MITNILLAGTGGQGVLSSAAMITFSAMHDHLFVSQSEVHGMAQRGGSVTAQVRIGDAPVISTLIPQGTVDLIISMEPLEGLRHASLLKADGHMVTATGSIKNFAGYPDDSVIADALKKVSRCTCFNLEQELRDRSLASQTGNMFLIGAASVFIPDVSEKAFAFGIGEVFVSKGERAVRDNIAAFTEGCRVGESIRNETKGS